mmetsp:Transcript_43112/g.138619  ORF Transcript_43112/g.138619 Transcript_43112/m.138619 type:complete len:359 (+) Transcript_43112:76-1152(+)|eukprot:CAMPEP_0203923640 /NCGR_PEP_ID=MMETSP0359-20131031/63495_1 /ASSEMBLY_ACC=CAM_ASM_000338 /TAXON_ID=268821 /ORGANISM="Scrippsiella Hangoei, Strain SHTV-5" /LENGTH=358 /DNA_ID=CAMNT_0050851743 /DNA_START=61 /DNA_END=1137 /DNA_ORIENTATION=+
MAHCGVQVQGCAPVLLGSQTPWSFVHHQKRQQQKEPGGQRSWSRTQRAPPAALDAPLPAHDSASTTPSSSAGSSPRRHDVGRVVLSLSETVEDSDSPMYIDCCALPHIDDVIDAPPGLAPKVAAPTHRRTRVPLSISEALVPDEVELSLTAKTKTKVELSLSQALDDDCGSALVQAELDTRTAGRANASMICAHWQCFPSQHNMQTLQFAHQASLLGFPPRRGSRNRRLWIHFHLHMPAPGFDLVAGLIGRAGHRVRAIADATGAKVRIRGRGSGHLEVDGVAEAPAPLMVAVTVDQENAAGFRTAAAMVLGELQTSEQRYRLFCQKHSIRINGVCYSVGAIADDAAELLGDVLIGMP